MINRILKWLGFIKKDVVRISRKEYVEIKKNILEDHKRVYGRVMSHKFCEKRIHKHIKDKLGHDNYVIDHSESPTIGLEDDTMLKDLLGRFEESRKELPKHPKRPNGCAHRTEYQKRKREGGVGSGGISGTGSGGIDG